jgi:hypothetical protein
MFVSAVDPCQQPPPRLKLLLLQRTLIVHQLKLHKDGETELPACKTLNVYKYNKVNISYPTVIYKFTETVVRVSQNKLDSIFISDNPIISTTTAPAVFCFGILLLILLLPSSCCRRQMQDVVSASEQLLSSQ